MRKKIIAIARTSLLVLGVAALSGCYSDHYRYGYADPGYGPYAHSTLPLAYAYAPPAYAYRAPAYRYRYDEEHHPVWHHEDREEHHARVWGHHHDDDDY